MTLDDIKIIDFTLTRDNLHIVYEVNGKEVPDIDLEPADAAMYFEHCGLINSQSTRDGELVVEREMENDQSKSFPWDEFIMSDFNFSQLDAIHVVKAYHDYQDMQAGNKALNETLAAIRGMNKKMAV